MRILSIISLLLLLSLVTLGVEIYSLDPALSPVYPFLILATIYITFFFLALLGWLGAQFAFTSMKYASSASDEEKNSERLPLSQLSLRKILTSLIVAFAPVALIAVSSLHSIQLFDALAIGVFELLALVYVFKRYH